MYHRILQYDNKLDSLEKYCLSIKKNEIVNQIFTTFNFNKIINTIQLLNK